MRVYVAAKTHDFLRARALMEMLREEGHIITFDWTKNVEEVGPSHENEKAQDKKFLLQCAENDAYGVKKASALIALGHPRVCGTLVEIGMALAYRIPVILVGEFPPSVFWELENVTQLPTELAAVAHLSPRYSMED